MLNYSRLDVALELRRVADYFEGLAEERGIALSCAGEGTLKADAMLFQRALSNLVAKAVRYADENSRIVLRAERRADAWWVQVINQGPPIAPAQLEKLFDRFYRADPARSAGNHASGLGLSIVRAIMTLHDGEVRAQCSDGRGSACLTFSLIFPSSVQ